MKTAFNWLDYRLREAALTLRCLKVARHDLPDGHGTYWPRVVRSVGDAYGYEGDPEHPDVQQDTAEQKRRREERLNQRVFAVQRERIDRLDEVLPWMLWLTKGQRHVVWGRAEGRSWQQLQHGQSIRTLQRQRDKALKVLLTRLFINTDGIRVSSFAIV